MDRLTPLQLQQALQILPAELGKQAEKVEDARKQLDLAKHNFNILEAQKYLVFEATQDKPTSVHLKAQVTSDPEMDVVHVKVIEAQGKYKQEEIQLKLLEDKFTAARKIATLREVELRNIPE